LWKEPLKKRQTLGDSMLLSASMNFECYGCLIGANMILTEEAYHGGMCWGSCCKCGLFVCSGHGRRTENPYEYRCLYCTGGSIEKWRPYHDPVPDSPTPPPGTMDEFVNAFSDLSVKIQDKMKEAIIQYWRENDISEISPLDDAALLRAAEAYRLTVGISRGIVVPEVAGRG
jgi:hypothetical protein